MWRFVMVMVFVSGVFAQDSLNQEAQTSVESSINIGSFWEISQLAGGIGYVIYAVLAIGLFIIFLQMLNLIFDYFGSREIKKSLFANTPVKEIENMVTDKTNTMLGELGARLFSFYKSSANTVDMHQEILAFVDQKTEKFEAFKGRLTFLSDSAGALGLMGTVYGVFITFFGGELDSEKILNGMGVALITTLLGLVVSLIINFFGTEISSAFQKRMEVVLNKGDELRLRLMDAHTRFEEKRTKSDIVSANT